MTAPTEREIQIAKITGMSPRRQRYWLAKGFHIDVFGNVTAPVSTKATIQPVVDEPSAGTVPSALGTLPLAPTWARRTVLHGLAGYGRGCRCGVCRDAQRVRMADYRQRRAAS